MFYMTMEKKTYIAPSMVSCQLNLKDGLLLYTSTTKASSAAEVETKYEDDYDLWDEE